MYALEDTLWWYRGQRKITQALFEKFLPNRVDLQILDIGAGTGGQLRQLRQWGEVTSFDFMEMACRFFGQRDSRRIAAALATAMRRLSRWPKKRHAISMKSNDVTSPH